MTIHRRRFYYLLALPLATGCATTDGDMTKVVHTTRTVYVQPPAQTVQTVRIEDPAARDAALRAKAQASAAAQQAQRAQEEARQANERAAQASERAESEAAARQTAERDVLVARADAAQAERDQALATLKAIATVDNTERGLVITLPAEVMFRFGSDELLPRAKEKLDALVSALDEMEPTQSLVIEGHTDSRGSYTYNRELSERRAFAVRAYLVAQGVGAERIIAIGRGEDVPVASNTEVEGRANNRRVEIVVQPATVSKR
jgi:outer membrane protein OmpA-like peptidoglycan-associated protein